MAFEVFNYKNQHLNAGKMREMSYFSTNNFGGIIGEDSPIYVEGNKAVFVEGARNVKFLAGGLAIDCTEQLDYTFAGEENLLCLEVTLDSSRASIVSNNLLDNLGNSTIKFNTYIASPMTVSQPFYALTMVEEPEGRPIAKGYYYFDEETQRFCPAETDDLEPIVYYARIESKTCTFGINGQTYNYNGNTIWLSENKFIVPLVVKSPSGVLTEVVVVRTKEDFENLMSLGAYAALKAFVEDTFVWHEGGKELAGTHRKGDIGDLNITDNIISHVNNTDDNLTDRVRLTNIQIDGLANENNCWNSKLIVNKDGSIDVDPDYKVPVEAGGTFSDANWDEKNPRRSAKQNLGIFYGTNLPPKRGHKEGDIYFKIVGRHDIPDGPPHPNPFDNFIFHPGYNYWGQPIYTVGDIFHPVVLSVSDGGVSYIDVDPVLRPMSHSFKRGLVATVVAVPNPGYVFSYWIDSNGRKVSTSRVYSFKVIMNISLRPVFKQIVRTSLVRVTSGRGGGAYIKHGGPIFPETRVFTNGDTCTIIAVPQPGYIFRYWKDEFGNRISSRLVYSFTVKRDITLSAVFI